MQLCKKYNLDERIKGTLAEQLRYDRCKNNWSLDYLGKLIGSKNALIKYERGVIMPTRERSMKLAYIFNTGTKYYHDDYLELTDDFKILIESILKKSRLSKRQFSLKLNISKRTLFRWLGGDTPTRSQFDKIKPLVYEKQSLI